jgi:hypothetical protein
VHHRPAARRVHAGARGAGAREQDEQHGEVVRVCSGREAQCGDAEADRQHRALAEAVGGEPPREERQERAHPAGREQQPHLAEAEPVLRAERRRQHRQADAQRRVAGLCGRAGGEHRPPVAVGSYSWKGFAGRVPVATITLFVSR